VVLRFRSRRELGSKWEKTWRLGNTGINEKIEANAWQPGTTARHGWFVKKLCVAFQHEACSSAAGYGDSFRCIRNGTVREVIP
jgi:hypothetical protein